MKDTTDTVPGIVSHDRATLRLYEALNRVTDVPDTLARLNSRNAYL
jgi:hypothetical protein